MATEFMAFYAHFGRGNEAMRMHFLCFVNEAQVNGVVLNALMYSSIGA